MIPLLCLTSNGPQPSYVVAIRNLGPVGSPRPRLIVESRKVGPKVGTQGVAEIRSTALAGRASFSERPGEGNLRFLAGPGADEFAAVYSDSRGAVRYVDVWSANPLRRIAEIRCRNAVQVDWLPGRSELAVVERREGGYETRTFSAQGKSLGRLARTLGIVSDPTTGTRYAARYALPPKRLKRLLEFGYSDSEWIEEVRSGTIAFVKVEPGMRVGKALSRSAALRVLLGPGASVASLATIASLNRPLGFARNWAVLRAGIVGPLPNSGYGLVYDQLGYPKARSKFYRSDIADGTYSMSSGGVLLYSANASGEGYRIAGEDGDRVAVAIAPSGKRYWLLRGVGDSNDSLVLWKE